MSDDEHRDDDEFQYDEPEESGEGDEESVTQDAPAAAGAVDEAVEEHGTKLCRYCVSEIDEFSTRCCRCGGDLRFVEGTDIQQNWHMLFYCVAIFVACIWLPIERYPDHFLYASHSFAGGFLAIFAAYGMLASYANILQRKAIYWPVLFMAFDGLYVAISRYIGLLDNVPEGAAPREYILMGGPALPIILICSLLSLWTFMKGIASGRSKAKAAKDAARRR